jgi:hypothetical protein
VNYFFITLACAATLWCLYLSFVNWRKARNIEDTPTGKVRSAAQGYIELTGFARAIDQHNLYSPLTGAPCLWYSFKVERYEDGRKSSGGSWKKVERGSSDRDFQLEDETGHCLIHPQKAEVHSTQRRWEGSTPRPTGSPGVGSNTASLLRRLVGARYRYTEQLIQAGGWLYVAGFFQTVNPPSTDEQAKLRLKQILSQWKLDHADLLQRFDQDGDGNIDMAEWEQARRDAANEAYRDVLDDFDHDPIHFMTFSPNKNQPYIISNRDPELLARKYRQKAALLAGAFVLLVTVFASGGYRHLLN